MSNPDTDRTIRPLVQGETLFYETNDGYVVPVIFEAMKGSRALVSSVDTPNDGFLVKPSELWEPVNGKQSI